MAPPNEFETVQAVWDQQPPALTTEGIGLFTERVASTLHATDRRWGHLKKTGAQSQFNGHAVNAILYLDDAPGQSTAVDICREHDLTITGPRWLVDVPRYSLADWFAPTTAPPPQHGTALGASLFWLLAGMKKYRPQLDENARWIKTELGGDFVRAFGVLGGDLFGGVDPWLDLATNWRATGFARDVRDATRYLWEVHGLKTSWTLVGGRAQVDLPMDQIALVDVFADALGAVLEMVPYVEMWNEYLVNNGIRHELRNMARRARALLPAGFPIALSSPNSIMGGNASRAEVEQEVFGMYGGDSGANLITQHPTRPDPIWNAETTPNLGLQVAIGEPRGPLASAGGDVDNPNILAADYQSAIRGRAIGYVYHSMAGIWGGHCHGFPSQNEVANLPEHRNAPAIAAALKSLRQTGQTGPIHPGGSVNPYPSEPDYFRPLAMRIAKTYEEAGRKDIAKLIELDPDAFNWSARTSYDVCAGLTKEASADKHIAELRQALGLP